MESLSSELKAFHAKVSSLQQSVNERRSEDVITTTILAMEDSAQRIERMLSTSSSHNPDAPEKTRLYKLTKDFRLLQQQASSVKALASSSVASAREDTRRAIGPTLSASSQLSLASTMHTETRVERLGQLDVDEAIRREREAEIADIHQSVTKVNQIFKDLASIVHDQQQDVDAVESMIEKSNNHAREGLNQLEKASSQQQEGGCTLS